ncbi:MAG: hypothetical protein OEY74_04745 [Gammaproteobacteria bacterium]|nr:hypothetical protein [Gammaproteobacteria bacterium]
MPRTGNIVREARLCLVLLAFLGIGGCSLFAPQLAEPVDEPVAEPVVEPVVEIETPELPAPVEPEPAAKLPEPPRPPPVAIVLTSRLPAFQEVADALSGQLIDAKVFDLSDESQSPVAVLRAINDSDSGTVVAIGLRAATSSVAMSDSPVIFAQVFNYQDHGLLTEKSRGIAPLAPLDAQLAAWIKLDPSIERVGIIIGEGHEALIDEAQMAADKHNITLHVRVARSDQETLYIFRRMAQNIDGFWLFPDNRILSARSLQKILETAKRGRIAVAVPNESMLDMGATIAIATQAEDIANTIARVIRKIHAEGLQNVPDISPLSAVRVVTRDNVEVVSR